MKCPHCGTNIHSCFEEKSLGHDDFANWMTSTMVCPECKKIIIDILSGKKSNGMTSYIDYFPLDMLLTRKTVYPEVIARDFTQRGIDNKFWNDYEEACRALAVSPKASAALSRRCLQNILREKAEVKKGDLSKEIQQVIDAGNLPSLLADSIDAIRNIGNFAAHPTKDKATGEIVEVEPGEAEWLLNVLEDLMDFYFIQPQKFAERKAELNKKLAAIGKPPMK